MTKKQKILGFNIIIVFLCYLLPYYLLNGEVGFRNQEIVQWGSFLTILIGSIILTFINNKFIKEFFNERLLFIIFKLIGIIGIIYSVGVIFILFYYRDGIGF
jgi:hypothetical protein